ncbi:MAG: phosphosulfolactate synthase [Euryarchaeota archaeon]|nr:phosphosulfolactate synthase [Euryarchaeota archaeon]
MRTILGDIQVPNRNSKPRAQGLTIVLDKGLGIRGAEDLLSTAGEFIDVIKLGWGTWQLFSKDLLKQKIELYRKNKIYVMNGGTSFEIALLQGKVKNFLTEVKELGLTAFEISEGVIDLTPEQRSEILKTAKSLGFKVFAEVGKKSYEKDQTITVDERIRLIKEYLNLGAEKVSLEARETGTTGIFNEHGEVVLPRVISIVKQVDIKDLIFEAPLKNQQVFLIKRFGPDVNLGNIRPEEVIPLETLRRGLRADVLNK